jgi:hypothetical protein
MRGGLYVRRAAVLDDPAAVHDRQVVADLQQ